MNGKDLALRYACPVQTECPSGPYLVCVCDEKHAVVCCGHLKSMSLVENVLCSFDGQAPIDLQRPPAEVSTHSTLPSGNLHGLLIKDSKTRCLSQTSMTPRGIESCTAFRRKFASAGLVKVYGWSSIGQPQKAAFVHPMCLNETVETCQLQGNACCPTGVTMSDLNQNIFPCFRTNHLHGQTILDSAAHGQGCSLQEVIHRATSYKSQLRTCAARS